MLVEKAAPAPAWPPLERGASDARGEELAAAEAPALAWLSLDVLILVVPRLGGSSDPEIVLRDGDAELELEGRWERYPRRAGAPGAAALVALAEPPLERSVEVVVEWDGERRSIGPAPAAALGSDVRTLAREELAPLDAESRRRLMGFLVRASSEVGGRVDQRRLARSLFTLRSALRDLSPRSRVLREEPQSVNVETIVGIDETSFFVRGWMRDERAEIVRLDALSPEGERAPMLDNLFRNRRPDVDQLYGTAAEREEKHGFLCYLELDAPSHLDRGWIFEMENAAGVAIEAEGPEVIRDPIAGRGTMISELARERGPDSPLMDHVAPAVMRLQERLASLVEIEHVEQFGSPPKEPETSIVVPLYQRIDLVQHQLASFADDPSFADVDLVYVLDSPELGDPLLAAAGDLHEIYRVPFRIAECSRNGGFAVANNVGASIATGRMLLLLNSDVIAAEPGWLPRMVELLDAREEVGAVGPKLLFDDGTLQHAGLYWRRPAPFAAWENAHYFKGIHGSLPAANVARPVPAITAACLLTHSDLYDELGGLRSIYIQGDYEDSDFCLRLREAGYETWYLPEVELYHLEGRSYDTSVRQANARFNSWLHTRLWGERIAALMADSAFALGGSDRDSG